MPGTTSPVANNYETFAAKGVRETLSDVISRVDPEDTPLQQMIGSESVSNTIFEWQTDVLRAAGQNANVQGFRAAPRVVSPTVRVGNYTQISADSFSISNTLEAVDKAGRRKEEAYQLVKVGSEIKRDCEFILLSANQGGFAGAFDSAPLTATLHAWVKTNVDKAGDGANPAYTSGVPSTGRTDGTLREATLAQVNAVMALCKANGAKPKFIFVNPTMKQKYSTFTGSAVAAPRFNQSGNEPVSIINAADVIVTDFGVLTIITDIFQRERDSWFVDPSMLKVRVLRPYMATPLGILGSSRETMVEKEWGLQVKNEKGLGGIFDIKTTP